MAPRPHRVLLRTANVAGESRARVVTLAGRLWPNGEVWAGHLARPTGLGLSNLRKNHKGVRGANGITAKGRRTVRQGAHLLESEYGKVDLSFLTCTLPGATMGECESANAAWPEITRRFIQDLRRELERKNLPTWIIGCTEFQPLRYQRTGQPWPHLHLVFVGRTGKPWLIGGKRITEMWARCVGAVLDIPAEALQWATRIEAIKTKKTVGRYLSKYMSKGSEEIAEILGLNPAFPIPHSWSHCSQDLNATIAKGTAHLNPKTAAFVIKLLQSEHPGAKLFAAILPDEKDETTVQHAMGYCGILDPPVALTVRNFNNIKPRIYD